ncbi:hypothetical protein Dsin_000772 [Dipteronia sinensis]|uniref:Phosphoinositide phospholipase C n=1 Tax=Dipteronia sinensis TaxID=43782 RepID=A0AAE0EHT8_9ROSI|nr:hypothetical protein Dsin_000772 [Dipteronia sinensis]
MWRSSNKYQNRENKTGNYHYKMFKCFNRKFRINEAAPPLDVKLAFVECTDHGDHMTAVQLRRFLVLYQEEKDCSLHHAEMIMEQVVQRIYPDKKSYHGKGLTINDFFHFLMFDDLNPPIRNEIHNDMDAPLSHYYIYTGHNSYLTGNQLSSDCSEVPIAKALQNGVRVIELDVWPNSSKDDINVLHGGTLTTPISLIRCLKTIKEFAFVTSAYPVIITLEDHLTEELQAKVAEMITETFGSMLYIPESQRLQEFPSPESLKYRIVISTKPPKEYLEEKDKAIEEEHELEADDKSDGDQEYEDYSDNYLNSGDLASGYRRLITIHAGKPKGSLRKELRAVSDKVRRLSLNELEIERAAASYGDDLVRFSQRNILRIYPKGTRVDSSNFKPLVAWMHGAQMIAFNMQGYGKSLWLMQGMFKANGGCGYLKKPDFLLKNGPDDEVFDWKRHLPVKMTLKVRVYMGDGWRLDFSHTHFDSYSPPDFYTKVFIVGVPADDGKKKTKIITDDWCPVWNEEFTFSLTVPELAILGIEVREHDMSDKDDFGGQTWLPVSEIKPGIRSIPLSDKKGKKFNNVRLLMRFEFVETK